MSLSFALLLSQDAGRQNVPLFPFKDVIFLFAHRYIIFGSLRSMQVRSYTIPILYAHLGLFHDPQIWFIKTKLQAAVDFLS